MNTFADRLFYFVVGIALGGVLSLGLQSLPQVDDSHSSVTTSNLVTIPYKPQVVLIDSFLSITLRRETLPRLYKQLPASTSLRDVTAQ